MSMKKEHKKKEDSAAKERKRNWREYTATVEDMEQGFRRVKSCGQRGYVVELRTGEEMQRMQRQMADGAGEDSGQYGQ